MSCLRNASALRARTKLHWLALLLAVAQACAVPPYGGDVNGPAKCVAAGGQCQLGGRNCEGVVGPQDCDPWVNPGGARCCLPCPAGETPNDAGPDDAGTFHYDTGCH